ncbi:MAG: hypothetical protein J7527_15935 [Chitinophagaceae bacterium]|nr:hypothetical protein [Chitinophagaceae bacterium]
MKPILTTLLLIMLFTACSRDKNEIILCPEPVDHPWLAEKKKEYSSCLCKTNFLSGSYEGRQVFEIRLVDIICDGINMVFDETGKELFHSGQAKYDDYYANVKNSTVIWTCSKPAGGQ